MDHNYSIRYADICLVPFTEAYSEQYRQLRNDPDVNRCFVFHGSISKEQQKQWFREYLNKPQEIMFAILDKNGQFIGGNSIYDIGNGSAEYGRLIINKQFSGNHYGFKATCAAMEIARSININNLRLKVYLNNAAAIKIYKTAGFIETGFITDQNDETMIAMERTI
ncbi:MAG: GNAT family N-acetyltransferase [Clostridia bacterium]|nr:GNAT family N-acetyltransferase [Clostridia bacterium]